MPPPSYPRGANMHSHDHSTGTGITTSRAAVHRLKHSSTETSRTIKMAPDNREIVVRDKNGGYKLEVPRLPPQALVSETGDGEELDDLDAGGSGNGEIAFGAELSGVDKESMFLWFSFSPSFFSSFGSGFFLFFLVLFALPDFWGRGSEGKKGKRVDG